MLVASVPRRRVVVKKKKSSVKKSRPVNAFVYEISVFCCPRGAAIVGTLNVCACARVRMRARAYLGGEEGEKKEREREKKICVSETSGRHVQRPLLFTLPLLCALVSNRFTGDNLG